MDKIFTTPMVDPDSSLFCTQQTETASSEAGSAPTENGDANDSDSRNMHQARDYTTVLTFIEGSLLGCVSGNGDGRNEGLNDSGSGSNEDSNIFENHTLDRATHSGQCNIPTLQQFADCSGKRMDDKQYIAYEVICCTFLLQLIYEGGDANTDLGRYLRATLHCPCVEKRSL